MITLVREEGLLPDSQAGRSIGYRQALEYLSSVWGFSGDKETRGTYTTKVYGAPSSLSCIEEIFLSVYGTLPATVQYRPVSVWYSACLSATVWYRPYLPFSDTKRRTAQVFPRVSLSLQSKNTVSHTITHSLEEMLFFFSDRLTPSFP